MQLGMIGLGRMGASLVQRLTKDGHDCVVYDVNPAAVKTIVGRGVEGAASLDDFIAKLRKATRGLGDGSRRGGGQDRRGTGLAHGGRRYHHRWR